jgi:hypothetical protein
MAMQAWRMGEGALEEEQPRLKRAVVFFEVLLLAYFTP